MSIRSREVRQEFPTFVVGGECRVSAAYQTETSAEGERITVRFAGAKDGGGSLTAKLEPETAIRLFGALGSEIRMREEHLEYRRKIEAESAEHCKAVGEGRS